MAIIVTGASGQFGRAAAEQLLKLVPPSDLILTTRKPEQLADLAAARPNWPEAPVTMMAIVPPVS